MVVSLRGVRAWLEQFSRRGKRVKMARFCKHWEGLALLAALFWTAGCANDSQLKRDDPLGGGGPAIPLRGETPASTTSAPRSGVPPLPVPNSATSNAALAGGAFQPLDPTRDLRIGTGDPNPKPGTWRGPAEGANAALNSPQPVDDKGTPGQLTSQPGPVPRAGVPPAVGIQPVGAMSGASADALLALLQARGVTWHRLETWGDAGEWKYSCSLPNPSNPNIRRTYESRGRDARSAMTAVLTQMDQERR